MNAKEQGLADTIMKMQEPDRLRAEIHRLQEAKRRALAIADERGKESNALRQENERLRAALWSIANDDDVCSAARAIASRHLEQKGNDK